MSLIFAAITPHSSILVPSIGKDDLQYLKKTVAAYKKLEEELYAAKPKTIIILTPRQKNLDAAFSINLYPSYISRFKEFGDFKTERTYKSDINLIHAIKESLETRININLFSEEELDHGCGVPLFYLTEHLKQVSVVPCSQSKQDYNCHYDFGKKLKEIIVNSNKRIAVIASASLSHRLSKASPLSYSEKGEVFDKKILNALKKNDGKKILHIDPELAKEAAECGLRSIIILLGILEDVNCVPEMLSYEFPFGVGQLVANFRLR